ncbi:MAG: hypothetical protein IJM30_12800 [Thermoguttaceae bacterium]|nr:hypothetical protein [Thermoguttaceae bacterium]
MSSNKKLRLYLEHLEDRNLLSVAPYGADNSVETDVCSAETTFETAVLTSAENNNDVIIDQLLNEVESVAIDNDSSSSPEESSLNNGSISEAFASDIDFEMIEISTGVVRQVVTYSSDTDDITALDFNDPTKYYLDLASLGSFENNGDEPNRSGGSGGGQVEPGTPTITSDSSDLDEAGGYSLNGGATSYFVFTVPDVPAGYQGFIEITGTAIIGSDFFINEGTSPASAPLAIIPGSNNTTRIAVSGGTSMCVFPAADNIVEPTETIEIAFGLTQNSGGTSIGGSISATIADAPHPLYTYVLTDLDYQYRNSWSSSRPAEEGDEWSWQDFVGYYYRSDPNPLGDSPEDGDCVSLNDNGLLDDYRRAMFEGDNLVNWSNFEDNLFEGIASNLLDGERVVVPPSANVNRDVTTSLDPSNNLFVYGNGSTNVTAAVYASLQSRTETYDSIGVLTITESYIFNVDYFCSIRDKFEDPLDLGFEVLGSPYWLTGEWTEHATYQITLTYERVEVPNQ